MIACLLLAWVCGFPAFGKVVYVSREAQGDGSGSDWVNACVTIAAGLAASASGDEVWVKSATYPEAVVMREGVALYGGFEGLESERDKRDWGANVTVIDATGLGTHAVVGADLAVLDGFTVTGGEGVNEDYGGGGIYCDGTSPTIAHCRIAGNTAKYLYGGGVHLKMSSASLYDCVITGNRAGGAAGVYCGNATPELVDCVISGNYDFGNGGTVGGYKISGVFIRCTIKDNFIEQAGGAFSAGLSSPTLIDCTVADNSMGWSLDHDSYGEVSAGLIFTGGSSPTLEGCVISNNRAGEPLGESGIYCWGGASTLRGCVITGHRRNGISLDGGSAKLENCVIARNRGYAISADFLLLGPSQAFLTNCTLVGNRIFEYGGSGVRCGPEARVTLVNCILRNQGEEIVCGDLASATVTHCWMQGGWPGEGNIDGDMAFVDADGGDFRLQPGSSCIGRGLLSAAPGEDLAGRPRPGGDGLVDIGACESPDGALAGPAFHVPRVLRVRPGAPGGGDGSSWGAAFSALGAALEVANTSDDLWVASGRYGEYVALERSVALYGGFAGNEESRAERNWAVHETVIDATGLGRSAVFSANLARLDGFTVTGGGNEPTVTWFQGQGIRCFYSSPTISNCLITGNLGSAVYAPNNNRPVVVNSLLTGNYGGVHGSARCINCTIAGNKEGVRGDVSLVNCILWGNQKGAVADTGEKDITWSDVEGGYEGEGNIDAPPLFADASAGDYALLAGSPCIDGGVNRVIYQRAQDLGGNVRIWDGDGDGAARVDMGAYEWGAPRPEEVVGNTDGDRKVDALDLFYFSRWWQFESNETNFRCDPLGDALIDEQDLLFLMPGWK